MKAAPCRSVGQLEEPRKIMAVYGTVGDTNVPLEAFLRQSVERAAAIVVSFNQEQEVVQRFLRRSGATAAVEGYGLGFGNNRGIAILRLFGLLRAVRPDLIHVHHAFSAAMVSFVGRWLFGCKVLLTIHHDFRTLRKSQQILLGFASLCSGLVVCNSVSTQQSLGWWGRSVLRNRLRVCYNGVNGEKVAEAAASRALVLRRENGEFVLGFVGRLVKEKDLPTLLRACSLLIQRGLSVRLAIAGDGELRETLEAECELLGIEGQVDFLGALGREEVYSLLQQVDAVVVSSRSEGFCNAMVEAMFAGKAVVATEIDVLIEVMGSDHGRFFSAGCPESLAERIMELSRDSGFRENCGRRLRDRAVSRFSLAASVESYAECYRELLDIKKRE